MKKNKETIFSLKTYKTRQGQYKSSVIVSAAIRPDQKKYLDDNGINFSVLLRDLLDQLIERDKKDE